MPDANRFHLAQLNVARMRAPLEDPIMADFVAQLEHVNAVAEASPGFIWRLQTDDGDATAIRAFDDERILVNMSVWESLEALRNYVYNGDHLKVLRQRKQWFEPSDGPALVLWWILDGQLPSVEDAKERLQWLAQRRPSAEAFTFAKPYPAPA